MPPSERPSLASRNALAMALVALVAVLLTGLVALPLVIRAAENQARRTLATQADLVAATVERQAAPPNRNRLARFRQLLRPQEVRLYVLRGAQASPLDPADTASLLGGHDVSGVRELNGGRYFVEGRTVEGLGIALVQPASVVRNPARGFGRTLLLALIAGLVGGGLVGLLLAQRLARPLQHASAAARRLAAGERDVRVEPEGPAEVADVAEAVNGLAGALAFSEGRQRDFLLSISHELRTPLTAVKGYAEGLADGVVPPEDVPRTARTMLAESGRLERLVSDLLDLARLGAQDFPLDIAPVDLTDIVARAAGVWRDRCGREGVQLRAELPARPVIADTDATRVRQIIDALAENALRVTPTGRPLVLALEPEEGVAVLAVRDGGPGLTDDDIAVAFEKSALYDRYRGERRVGTGVGLALVAGLTARLGGTAVASHAPEGGAAFTIRLPVTLTFPEHRSDRSLMLDGQSRHGPGREWRT